MAENILPSARLLLHYSVVEEYYSQYGFCKQLCQPAALRGARWSRSPAHESLMWEIRRDVEIKPYPERQKARLAPSMSMAFLYILVTPRLHTLLYLRKWVPETRLFPSCLFPWLLWAPTPFYGFPLPTSVLTASPVIESWGASGWKGP